MALTSFLGVKNIVEIYSPLSGRTSHWPLHQDVSFYCDFILLWFYCVSGFALPWGVMTNKRTLCLRAIDSIVGLSTSLELWAVALTRGILPAPTPLNEVGILHLFHNFHSFGQVFQTFSKKLSSGLCLLHMCIVDFFVYMKDADLPELIPPFKFNFQLVWLKRVLIRLQAFLLNSRHQFPLQGRYTLYKLFLCLLKEFVLLNIKFQISSFTVRHTQFSRGIYFSTGSFSRRVSHQHAIDHLGICGGGNIFISVVGITRQA